MRWHSWSCRSLEGQFCAPRSAVPDLSMVTKALCITSSYELSPGVCKAPLATCFPTFDNRTQLVATNQMFDELQDAKQMIALSI